jgi:phage baseplate assembly protein W
MKMANQQEQLGRDLKLRFDQTGADLVVAFEGDFDTVADEDNLAQAIIARLATDEGELYDIGHADYGSRLHDVIGEVNNATTRQRIKAKVEECLVQETRIKQVANINVVPDPDDPHAVDIEIAIVPIKGSDYLTVSFPFRLEG